MRLLAFAALTAILAGCGVGEADVVSSEDLSSDEMTAGAELVTTPLRINECRPGTGGYVELTNIGDTVVDLDAAAGACHFVDDIHGGSAPRLITDTLVTHAAGSTTCHSAGRPSKCALVAPGERVYVTFGGLNTSSGDSCRLLQQPGCAGAINDLGVGGPTISSSTCSGRIPDGVGSWVSFLPSCTPGAASNGTTSPKTPIVINEFKAGTSGWVEIINPVTGPSVDLSNWKIDDVDAAGAKPVELPFGTWLAAHTRLVIPFGGINVSSTDQVRLLDAGGAVVDAHSNYFKGSSITGKCFGRSPDGTVWSASAFSACTQNLPNPVGACPGGTYGGVTFTAAEECKAIDFLNKAPMSALSLAVNAGIPYDCAPDGTCGTRTGAWKHLGQLMAHPNATLCGLDGAPQLSHLKLQSGQWTPGGPGSDTVASLYANRTAMKQRLVTIDRAYIAAVIPNQPVEQSCVVIKDSPTSSTFITACEYVNPYCDCSGAFNWAAFVGTYGRIRGTFNWDPYLMGGRWTVQQPKPNTTTDTCRNRQFFTEVP